MDERTKRLRQLKKELRGVYNYYLDMTTQMEEDIPFDTWLDTWAKDGSKLHTAEEVQEYKNLIAQKTK